MADTPEVIEVKEKTDDKKYYEEIVKTNPVLIEWANDEIRDNKEIILNAVKENHCFLSLLY